MTERHPLWQLADELQMDLRNASAKLVALRARLAALELPDKPDPKPVCPECFCAGTHTAECSQSPTIVRYEDSPAYDAETLERLREARRLLDRFRKGQTA